MIHIGVKNEANCNCEFERTGKFLNYGKDNLVEVECIHCHRVTYFGVHDLKRVKMVKPEESLSLID